MIKYRIVLIIIFFMISNVLLSYQCLAISSKNKVIEDKNSYTITFGGGRKILVARKDFDTRMSWTNAVNACKRLGEGWRLPSVDELKGMYNELFLERQGNFEAVGYWSSERYYSYGAWWVNFNNYAEEYNQPIYAVSKVRAVKDLGE